MKNDLLKRVRQAQPIVFNIANRVTPQVVANAIAYIGASPIMGEDIEEVPDLVKIAQAVTLNLGSTSQRVQSVMLAAGKAANAEGKPVIFDPVAAGATPLRRRRAQELVAQVDVTIVRGNLGEIATLAGFDWQAHGIDAGSGQADPALIVKKAAQQLKTIVVATGPSDLISDGQAIYRVDNSAPELATNVGMGDALDGLLGAFASQSKQVEEIAYAAASLPVAGELALADGIAGPADFLNKTFDHLANLTDAELSAKIKLSKVENEG
ncbi:hydroxyethylthiazole kinase [Eupransor demetentiae]|uniref:Hydroxyethylthiazole kinase n=1 Tax=Eupransor demetentiae TaxID=3109584 RepID=A0ABP0ETE2_9LACO|nr:Hydroxyethylthiazole kinase [Lactobacillaceae bacterium LMG 33000]